MNVSNFRKSEVTTLSVVTRKVSTMSVEHCHKNTERLLLPVAIYTVNTVSGVARILVRGRP